MYFYLRNKIKCFLLRKKVRTGRNVRIIATIFEGKNTLFENVHIDSSFVGLGSYIQKNSNIQSTSIGRYCSIADNVYTCIGTHPVEFLSRYPGFYYDTTKELGYTYHNCKPAYEVNKYPDSLHDYQIKIGNDVWIGSHVLIMGGVSIGDGAVVAAGSVVTKRIPPYQVWGGVPAKFIRLRFDDELASLIKNIQWWNKSEEWILNHANMFKGIVSNYELNIIDRQYDE